MNSFVKLEEIFGLVPFQEKSLHGRNLVSFFQDPVKNLSSLAVLKHMWLDQAQGAVGQKTARASVSSLISKEDTPLHLTARSIEGAMNCILDAITSKKGPNRCRIFRFGRQRIFMPNYLPNLGNRVLANNFKANHDIRAQKFLNFVKIWALGPICKKLMHRIMIQFQHLCLINFKTPSLPYQIVDNFSNIDIRVRFYHYKSSLTILA